MTDHDTPAARAAAVRAVLRLLASLARRAPGVRPEGETFDLARRRGWVECDGEGGGWRLSRAGREVLRRAMSGQDLAEASAAAGAKRSPPLRPDINLDESPLAWLKRHKGRDGSALISEAEFLAGERLRADFFFARMTPRITSRWDAAGASGGRRSAPGAGVEISDRVIAAQTRVRDALAAVGPELSGVLIDVCCHLKGIEDAERQAGWPQRAGKVVLRLALAALSRHYGMSQTAAGAAPARVRHWGAADYRPGVDEWS